MNRMARRQGSWFCNMMIFIIFVVWIFVSRADCKDWVAVDADHPADLPVVVAAVTLWGRHRRHVRPLRENHSFHI